MYNEYQKKLSAIAKTVFLSDKERLAMRSALCAHMQGGVRVVWHAGFLSRWAIALYPFRIASAALMGVVAVSSGIVYSAEQSLPGDRLYPIKVEVNERVWGLAAISYEAQAEWSVERTTRRLQELEQLATAGSLDEKARDEITSRFEQQASEANRAIVKLKSERMDRAANTSSQLESSLRVHERSLMQVAQQRADIGAQLHGILDTVREKAENVSEIRLEIEKEIANAQHMEQSSMASQQDDKADDEHDSPLDKELADTEDTHNATTTEKELSSENH